MGCGCGIWSVHQTACGWQVTGIDIVFKAIRQARNRVRAADVVAQFIQGDVITLRAAGIEPDYEFIVNFECFNQLNDAQREAVGYEVSEIAAPDASML